MLRLRDKYLVNYFNLYTKPLSQTAYPICSFSEISYMPPPQICQFNWFGVCQVMPIIIMVIITAN